MYVYSHAQLQRYAHRHRAALCTDCASKRGRIKPRRHQNKHNATNDYQIFPTRDEFMTCKQISTIWLRYSVICYSRIIINLPQRSEIRWLFCLNLAGRWELISASGITIQWMNELHWCMHAICVQNECACIFKLALFNFCFVAICTTWYATCSTVEPFLHWQIFA